MKLLGVCLLAFSVWAYSAGDESIQPEELHLERESLESFGSPSDRANAWATEQVTMLRKRQTHCWDGQSKSLSESRDCRHWRYLEKRLLERQEPTKLCWPVVSKTPAQIDSCGSPVPISPWGEKEI
jgi:hypothetical protein